MHYDAYSLILHHADIIVVIMLRIDEHVALKFECSSAQLRISSHCIDQYLQHLSHVSNVNSLPDPRRA